MQANPFQSDQESTNKGQYNTAPAVVVDALAVLAILPSASNGLIASVLSHDVSAEMPLIRQYAPPTQKQLANDDPGRYHALCSRILSQLSRQLPDLTAEQQFIHVLEPHGNLLLMEDPDRFSVLVAHLQTMPFVQPTSQQLVAYFTAAQLVRSAEIEQAYSQLNHLLSTPDIAPRIRARSLNARAVCQRVLGNPQAALTDYNTALAAWRALGDRHFEAVTLKNIATLANGSLQQPLKCIDALQQAATIFAELDEQGWLAAVHNNLGIVHHDLGQLAEARDYLQRSLARRRFEQADDQIAASLLNIGEIDLYQGNLTTAQQAFAEALEKFSTPLYQIDAHIGIGLALQAQNEPTDAKKAYDAAMQLALEIGRNEILPLIHYRLANLHQLQSDTSAARDHLEQAATLIENSRTPLSDDAIKISLLGRWQQIYEALILLCLDMEDPKAAFLWSERARARAFSEGLNGAADAITLDQLQAVLPPQLRVQNFVTTGVVERDIPLLRALRKDNPLRPHLLTPPRIIRFSITHNSFAATACPLDPNALSSGSARIHDGQRFLDRRILPRLATALLEQPNSDNTVTTVVIPHGPLHHVPFAALLGDQPLSYAPSTTILRHQLRPKSPPLPNAHSLAIAYNGSGERGTQLTLAEREATMVADLTGGQTITQLDNALLHAASHLHFACHGWFNHEQPLASYLEIGPNVHLTAQDVMGWQLSAELVTLSACQTGISKILRSDEPMGLVRAFLHAGARNVLVTQWSVEDLPTFLFMQRFYLERTRQSAAVETEPLAVVLRDVQTWLRTLNSAELQTLCSTYQITPDPHHLASPTPFADPKHWAAFALIGP